MRKKELKCLIYEVQKQLDLRTSDLTRRLNKLEKESIGRIKEIYNQISRLETENKKLLGRINEIQNKMFVEKWTAGFNYNCEDIIETKKEINECIETKAGITIEYDSSDNKYVLVLNELELNILSSSLKEYRRDYAPEHVSLMIKNILNNIDEIFRINKL